MSVGCVDNQIDPHCCRCTFVSEFVAESRMCGPVIAAIFKVLHMKCVIILFYPTNYFKFKIKSHNFGLGTQAG